MTKPEDRYEQDNSGKLEKKDGSFAFTRREFVQYSTFALVAAVFSTSLPGCGGGGGDSGSECADCVGETFTPNIVGPGQVLEIKSLDSPGASTIPEDIFSVEVSVDDAVSYLIRPTYFKEGWIGVVIPPMIQGEDGNYFDSKEVEVRFSVQDSVAAQFNITMRQETPAVSCGEYLLPLLDEIESEMSSIEDQKETLFQDTVLLDKWDSMYPLTRAGLDSLHTAISSVCDGNLVEVRTIGGDIYQMTPEDIAKVDQLIAYLSANEPDGMTNAFLNSIPEPGGSSIRMMTAVLGYALPGAFLAMTRDWTEVFSGTGIITAIITASIPAASMCVAGNCLRLLQDSDIQDEQIMKGLNWYANILMNQGLYSLNDHMIWDFSEGTSEIMKLVTQDSIDLLEDLTDSLWDESTWSNSTPWSNGTPWSNSSPWSNSIWSNQPWNHMAWNNTTPWNNNIWSNNVWNNATPWSNNTWSNAPTWNNNAWNNAWNNTWSNAPVWNNFVNSGSC